MRNISILILVFAISINASIINSKQLFNKSIVKVKQQNISISKIFYATSTYDETKVNDIVLRYSGFIKDLNANSTHKLIKKGDLLFKVYSKELVSSFDELLLAMRYNQNKTQIRAIEDRLKLLGITNSTIAKVKRAKKTPYYIRIYSKYTGVVMNKSINEQSFAKAGQRLFSLANLSSIWVDANIYQKDLKFIKKGMNANVYIDGVGVYKAKVDLIHPILDNKTKTIPVRLIINNKDKKIFPNMFAKVQFIQKATTMLTLPKSAVITKGAKHYVFKPIEDNQFEPIEVKARRISNNKFEILSGLKDGDTVINNALFMLDSDALTNGLYNKDDDW